MIGNRDPNCGGCRGEGSHRRWCPAVVGLSASLMGRRGEKAEHLADEVGANSTAAANHLYTAAALLKARARELAEHHGAPGGEVD